MIEHGRRTETILDNSGKCCWPPSLLSSTTSVRQQRWDACTSVPNERFIVRDALRAVPQFCRSYFFQGASGNDKPDSKTMRSLDSTPLGNPLTTYASIA
jgi:hypothetical protein